MYLYMPYAALGTYKIHDANELSLTEIFVIQFSNPDIHAALQKLSKHCLWM